MTALADDRAVATAWRVHQIQLEWSGRVDSKASVVLTLETAGLGAVLGFGLASPRAAAGSTSFPWGFQVGMALLALAIVLAGAAVFPQLTRRLARARTPDRIIFFGHLRRWAAADLAAAYSAAPAAQELSLLCQQIVTISAIVWRKQTLIQVSMLVNLVGILLAVGTLVLG